MNAPSPNSQAHEAIAAYQAGEPATAIAKRLRISTRTMYEWLKQSGVERRRPRTQSASSGKRLTPAQLAIATTLYNQPVGFKTIAQELGVTAYIVEKSLEDAGVIIRHAANNTDVATFPAPPTLPVS